MEYSVRSRRRGEPASIISSPTLTLQEHIMHKLSDLALRNTVVASAMRHSDSQLTISGAALDAAEIES